MRLTPEEIDAIKDCAAHHFGAGAVVRLFGSRVRDDLRGGDIDLHVIAETKEQAGFDREWRFKDALERRIGEERVDVILRAPDEVLRPIDHIAVLEGVVVQLNPSLSRRMDASSTARIGRPEPVETRETWIAALTDAVQAGVNTRAGLIDVVSSLDRRLPLDSAAVDDLDRLSRLETHSLLLLYDNMVALILDQLIRLALLLSEEEVEARSRLDQRHAAEKLGALPAGLDFPALISARNRVAQQYPNDPERQAEMINAVARAVPVALAAFAGLEAYATRLTGRG